MLSEYDRLREQLHAIWTAPVFDHQSWHKLCCDLWDLLDREFNDPKAVNKADRFLDGADKADEG